MKSLIWDAMTSEQKIESLQSDIKTLFAVCADLAERACQVEAQDSLNKIICLRAAKLNKLVAQKAPSNGA